jgi:hypothetical protein
MMKCSVGVSFYGTLFAVLLPIGCLFLDNFSKTTTTIIPNLQFCHRKVWVLFKVIKKCNEEFAILKGERRRPETPCPNLCCCPSRLKTTRQPASRICKTRTAPPGIEDRREEKMVFAHVVFDVQLLTVGIANGMGLSSLANVG